MAMPASDKKQDKFSQKKEAYERKKNDIIKQYAHLLSLEKGPVSLQKDSSNLFRDRKETQSKIDLREFSQILSVDPVAMVAEIEGMATYEDIVKETLKHHCLPTVVPELKSITIGGALAGVGIESSSFRYGLVHESIFEYEVLLGDGRIVTCRRDNEHKDLFFAFPNSYGTLGYALKVKVKLIPVKKYVKLSHQLFQDPKTYFEAIKQKCLDNYDPSTAIAYIDGVIFNKNEMILTTAEFTDTAPFLSNYKYLQIYYRSLQKKHTDYLTTLDYIWRWDTDWFWCSKNFYMQYWVLRLLFGKFILHSKVFWKIRRFFMKNAIGKTVARILQGKVESVIQDIQVPVDKANDFLTFFQKDIGISPVWVCPVRPSKDAKLYSFYAMDPKVLYVNFGFWDAVSRDAESSHEPEGFLNKQIEKWVQSLQGFKSLYSDSYYSFEEFWKIYDKNWFEHLKDRYDPKRCLKDLYQKCVRKA